MRKLFILLLLSLSINVIAQEPPKIKHESESRVSVTLKKSFLEETLDVNFSPEIRFGLPFELNKTLLKFGAVYDLRGWFDIGVGANLIFDETSNGTKTEVRFNPHISRTFKLGKFRIIPRVRLINYQASTNGSGRQNLLRYRLVLEYKYAENAIFQPSIAVEAYHKLQPSFIASVRYRIGGDFRINERNSICIQYLIDTKFHTQIYTSILKLGYEYNF